MVALLLPLLLSACAGGRSGQHQPRTPKELPNSTVRSPLGTEPLGLVVEVRGGGARDHAAIQIYFAQAFSQSPAFDLARSALFEEILVLRGELHPSGGADCVLTTTWQRKGKAPIPLAKAEFPRARLGAGIDKLSSFTRKMLGENPRSIAATSKSCEQLVSPSVKAAALCNRALDDLDRAQALLALGSLDRALRISKTSPLALSLSAAMRLSLGQVQRARELAIRCLKLSERAHPQSIARAERVVLMSERKIEDLLGRAEAGLARRPRDPELRFNRALALCLLDRYQDALPILRPLSKRLPASQGVSYCLGHALLATGALEEATALLPEIRRKLPLFSAARLESWILLAQKKHEALSSLLEKLQKSTDLRGRPIEAEVLGMQAAHAILQGKDKEAARKMLQQLDVLRAHPGALEANPMLLPHIAWTLARLGASKEAAGALRALRGTGFPSAARGTGAVAWTLLEIAGGKKVEAKTFENIRSFGLTLWAKRLEAAASMRKGNPARAWLLLRGHAEETDDPTLLLETAEALLALGREREALGILDPLAKELRLPRMRFPRLYPLSEPGIALCLRLAERGRSDRAPSRR